MFSHFLSWHDLYVSLKQKAWKRSSSVVSVSVQPSIQLCLQFLEEEHTTEEEEDLLGKLAVGKSKRSGKEGLDLEPPCGLLSEKATWEDLQRRILVVVYKRSIWARIAEKA